MTNFVIPSKKEDLLKSTPGQFYVEEILSTRLIPVKLQDAKVNLLKDDGMSIDVHFEALFSVLCKFNELDASIKQLAWMILIKISERFCAKLQKVLNDDGDGKPIWESSDRTIYLSALKMFVYLLVQMSELHQSSSRQHSLTKAMVDLKVSKRRTKSKGTSDNLGIDWESECAKSFHILMNFVDLDIHRLWRTQMVEDDFTSLITNFCYKVLEDQNITKNKSVRTNVFHLLGCVIKKHNQSLSSSLKIVQMMQHFEHISSPLAEAMHLWVTTYKCKSLIPEILRELSNIEEQDLVRDNVSTRTICSFLQDLGKLVPSEILPHISLLLSRMNEEPYPMRNTVLTIFGEILLQCLNGETTNAKAKSDRDQFLDILYDHASLDCNAFVRSKAVQILLMLVKAQALPIKRSLKIVDLGVRLLLDKSNLVRKSAVQLLVELLQWNSFAPTLSIATLRQGLKEARTKLEELRSKEGPAPPKDGEGEAVTEKESDKLDDGSESQSTQSDKEDEVDEEEEKEVDEEEEVDVEDSEAAKQQKVVTFLSDTVAFVEKFHEAVPVLCQLLRSHTQSDVLEAINFFTVAWKFKLEFALQGITGMLEQIWNEDHKIRDAVVYAYKEFYFKSDSKSESPAQHVVDSMVHLAASSTKEKLEAVESLLSEMNKAGDIPSGVPQVLWKRFLNPPSSFTMSHGVGEAKQRIIIVQLLGMFAKSDPEILKSKVGVLVDVGLVEEKIPGSSQEKINYELAKHTCCTLLKLSQRNLTAGKYSKQFRFPNDNKIFVCLFDLLTKGIAKESESWINFALEAIALIFQLAAKPIHLATSIFSQLKKTLDENLADDDTTEELLNRFLTRFFSVCGHLALKHLTFVECDIYSEIKRRRKLEEDKEESAKKTKKSKRRSKSANTSKNENLEEEMGVGGATADDADQEMIKNVVETEIVGPDSLLGSITEMLVRASSADVNTDDDGAVKVQASASLALSKYMLVSSEFCEKHMRLFMTLLQSSPHECVRANLTVAAGDLCVRFPNMMEPWTSNLYSRLNDSSTKVRIFAINVLTNLILHDMIKVKGHVSEMAKCIADENTRISMLAKRFFQELSKKGNSVYNVMPDIISRLSDPEIGVKDDVDFKSIMRFLFDFIQKDKQSESLVEKLCHRFKSTWETQQWRDLAFCLSLLNYSEKAVKKLIENFSFYSQALRDEQVYYSFDAIISKSKKFAKPDLKVQIEELEGKLLDHHTQGHDDDQSAARAAEASKKFKLPRSQSVSQTPAGSTPRQRRFSLLRNLSIPCAKLALSPETPLPARRQKRAESEKIRSKSTSFSEQRKRFSSNKRFMASSHKDTRKKRRESEDEELGLTPEVRKVSSRRIARKKKVVDFSSDEEDDLDDLKENVAIEAAEDHDAKEEELNLSQISNESTPIRRKKTPKRAGIKSSLRV